MVRRQEERPIGLQETAHEGTGCSLARLTFFRQAQGRQGDEDQQGQGKTRAKPSGTAQATGSVQDAAQPFASGLPSQ